MNPIEKTRVFARRRQAAGLSQAGRGSQGSFEMPQDEDPTICMRPPQRSPLERQFANTRNGVEANRLTRMTPQLCRPCRYVRALREASRPPEMLRSLIARPPHATGVSE